MVLDEFISFAVSFNLWINASSSLMLPSVFSWAYDILLSLLYWVAPIQLFVPSSLSTLLSLSKSNSGVLGGSSAFNSWKNLMILDCRVSLAGSSSNIFVSRNSSALSTSTIDDYCCNGMNWLTFEKVPSCTRYCVMSNEPDNPPPEIEIDTS